MSKKNLRRLKKENEVLKEKCADKSNLISNDTLTILLDMEMYLNRNYEFRYNTITQCTEYRKRGTIDYDTLDNRHLNSICMAVRKSGIECWDRDVSRFIFSTRVKEYHPLHSYMEKLPLWDGKDRVTDLAICVSNDDYWVRSFHRWMLAVTAQWMGVSRTHANSVAPVLISTAQGLHKSTFLKELMPPELHAYYTDDFTLGSKGNAIRKLSEYGLVSIDEFDKESAGKMPLLKNLMQMTDLSFIKSHQKNFCKLPRIASFVATTNRKDILTDPSGSRRFICVEVKEKIQLASINHTQLYAQLRSEITSGERYWFDASEEAEIQLHNKPFYRTSVEEELFYSCFDIPKEGEEGIELTSSTIFAKVKKKFPGMMRKASAASFGRQLVAMGLKSIHTREGNKYVVKVV